MGYSSLFNHTADTKAQNRVIQHMLNLTHIIKRTRKYDYTFIRRRDF